ncbi:MAG: ATP-grasp fold amidoligase family protein [Pseudomonadota bacterium]
MADRLVLAIVYICTRVKYGRLIRRFQRQEQRRLDYILPHTYEGKFLWRKIFDRNPLFIETCDKLAAQHYARSKIKGVQVAKLIWRGSDPDEITPQMLKDGAVLKANCGSGQAIVIPDGSPTRSQFSQEARQWLRKGPFGLALGEWPYAFGDNCLILEELLTTDGRPVEVEYKFHVAAGETACVVVKRGSGQVNDGFLVLDRFGKAWTVTKSGKSMRADFDLPDEYLEMRQMAEALGSEFDYVRVDLYLTDAGVYFSELTVFPSSGGGKLGHKDLEDLRNRQWDVRRSWFLSARQTGWRQAYANALRRHLDQIANTT